MKPNEGDAPAVKEAAKEAGRTFFPRAENRKATFGFEPGDDLNASTLGTPICLYELDESRMSSYKAGDSIIALLRPTGQWLVPVQIGNTNRAMISVVSMEPGKWTGSTFGMAPLARKWQNIQGWWPAEKFHPKLVIFPAAQGYFFTIPEVHPPNLTPLEGLPGKVVDWRTESKPALQPASSLLTELRDTLKEAAKSGSENSTNNTQSQ